MRSLKAQIEPWEAQMEGLKNMTAATRTDLGQNQANAVPLV